MSDINPVHRALEEAVPTPPSTEGWAHAAARSSHRRRQLGAGVAAALVVALAVPVAMSWSGGTVPVATPARTTQTLATETPEGGREATIPAPSRGEGTTAAPSYHVRGTAWLILQNPDDELPVACMLGVAESYPPQCVDQLPLRGMSWDDVEHQEVDGIRFTERGYDVVGDYVPEKGKAGVLTLTAPPSPYVVATDTTDPDPSPTSNGAGPFCRDPYVDADPDLENDDARSEIMLHLDERTDVVEEMAVGAGGGRLAFNVVVNSDADRTFAELRKLWGGGLCVAYEDAPSEAELRDTFRKIQDAVTAPGEAGPVLDGQATDRRLTVLVYLYTPELEQQIRAAAGDGVNVEIESVLTLVK